MAAAVAAALALTWRAGRISKVLASLLVALQVVWGGDVYFFPTHAMLDASPIPTVVSLMSTGHRKDFRARDTIGGDFAKAAGRLPAGSKVLIHEMQIHLGIRAPTVNDFGPWQGGISYGRIPSPRALQTQFTGYGVTHFLWHPKKSEHLDNLAGSFVFFEFAGKYLDSVRHVGGLELGQVPRDALPDRMWLDETTVVAVCPGSYAPGIYRLGDLTVSGTGEQGAFPMPMSPIAKADLEAAMQSASFVAYEESCFAPAGPALAPFTLLATREKQKLMSRKDAR